MSLTFVACLLLGTLAIGSQALDLPLVSGSCGSPSGESSLDDGKFFSGKWYIHSNYGFEFLDKGTKCQGAQFKVAGGGVKAWYYTYDSGSGSYFVVESESSGGASGGKVNFQTSLGGSDKHDLPSTVVATDYDNYAVLYICNQQGGDKFEVAVVLVRDRKSSYGPHSGEIESAVSSCGLSIGAFDTKEESPDCGPNEPDYTA